jgi:hypothetical protein
MKKIIFAIFLLLLAALLIIVFLILNRSANGLTQAEENQDLTRILGHPASLKDKVIPTGNVLFKGKYYSFAYPASATKYKPNQVDTSLESFDFDMSSPRIYAVSEVIAATPMQKKLDDNSGVRMRQAQSSLYQQSAITADNQPGLSFEKNDTDGVEKSGFFLVNGKYYSFSLVGSDKQSIDGLFLQLMSSLKFL